MVYFIDRLVFSVCFCVRIKTRMQTISKTTARQTWITDRYLNVREIDLYTKSKVKSIIGFFMAFYLPWHHPVMVLG